MVSLLNPNSQWVLYVEKSPSFVGGFCSRQCLNPRLLICFSGRSQEPLLPLVTIRSIPIIECHSNAEPRLIPTRICFKSARAPQVGDSESTPWFAITGAVFFGVEEPVGSENKIAPVVATNGVAGSSKQVPRRAFREDAAPQNTSFPWRIRASFWSYHVPPVWWGAVRW